MYYMYCNSLVLKKLESLKWGSFRVVHYDEKYLKKLRLLLSSNKAVIQVLEAQNKIKV